MSGGFCREADQSAAPALEETPLSGTLYLASRVIISHKTILKVFPVRKNMFFYSENILTFHVDSVTPLNSGLVALQSGREKLT